MRIGHSRVLARPEGYPSPSPSFFTEKRCTWAAEMGHLDVLKYARENGCPWNEETCEEAARGGHLDVLKYLHENGCPWNEKACEHAAEMGHLDVLKYLH